MESKNSNELFVQQLRETLSAEKAILAGLPKLATNASADDQVEQVEYYARRTLERINRLEQLPELASPSPGAGSSAIGGVLAEFTELFGQARGPEVREAAVVSLLQTMRHFTIARYAALSSWAALLRREDLARALLIAVDAERVEAVGAANAAGGGPKDRSKDISMGERLTALFDRKK